jgi:hypothetical protein
MSKGVEEGKGGREEGREVGVMGIRAQLPARRGLVGQRWIG